MRLEVRCCCQPKKLLGWVDVPRHMRPGEHIVLPVAKHCPPSATFRPWDELDDCVLHLPIVPIHDLATGRTWLAVKAEGVPIETLRRVVGFEEAE